MSSGFSAMRMWLATAPPFWARAALSRTPTPFPSRSDAMATVAPLPRPPFVGAPRHIENPDRLPFEMCRHAQDRPDRDDAGAADAGHDDAVGLIDRRQLGIGKGWRRRALGNAGRTFRPA